MGVFDTIKKAIFGEARAETVAVPTPAPAPGAVVPPSGTSTAPATSPAGTTGGQSTTGIGSPSSSGATTQFVDVAPILDRAVQASGQQLDWKTSIVDLLKALKIDSSLGSRKELARELGYSGDTNDSPTMNIWLHKAVIKKLSENGGKVPADLLD